MGVNMNNEKIRLNKNGHEVICDVLFTFDSEDTLKSYVGYTDHSVGKNGRKNIYVSAYSPFKLQMELENITDEKELSMIENVLQQFDEETSK